jgi:hypothetical protein
MEMTEPVFWYATESRVFAWWKLAWDDDRGKIDRDGSSVLFAGQQRTLRMSRLTSVPLPVWVIPWAAVASLVLGNAVVLLMASAGAFNYLTLDNPLTYVLLVVTDLFALAFWPMQWVRVDYIDEQGRPGRAYFTAGSFGGRWNGGVRRLQEWLRKCADPGN